MFLFTRTAHRWQHNVFNQKMICCLMCGARAYIIRYVQELSLNRCTEWNKKKSQAGTSKMSNQGNNHLLESNLFLRAASCLSVAYKNTQMKNHLTFLLVYSKHFCLYGSGHIKHHSNDVYKGGREVIKSLVGLHSCSKHYLYHLFCLRTSRLYFLLLSFCRPSQYFSPWL